MSRLTFGGVCAGILGFELGLTRAGLVPRWVAEIDSKCSKLIAERAPGVPNYGDIRGVSFRYGKGWKRYRHPAPVDVMVGGFPCQDVSIAGKRAGLAGSRSGLWFEFLRLIAEARPQWAIIENVPGLLSSNEGRDFAAILSGLAEIGYMSAWRVLDAQYFGVAQRRRRVFIVASLGDGRCAEVLFERESLSWDSAPSREAGAFTSALTANGVGVRGADDNQAQARHLIAQSQYGDLAGTLSARHDSSPCADRGQNVVAYDIRNQSETGDITHPIQAKSTPGHSLNYQPVVVYQCHGNNVGPMGTLREGNGGLTGGVPFVFQSKASALQSMNPSEITPALDVGKSGGMAVTWESRYIRNGRGRQRRTVL